MATIFIDLRTEFDRTEFRLIEVHVIKRLTRKRTQEIYVDSCQLLAVTFVQELA
jgi:hypothetical protein